MQRLLLDERILADGGRARTYARLAGDHVHIEDEGGTHGERADGALSVEAVDRVMLRYGKPLDSAVALDGDVLDAGGGRRLRRLRFHAIVDAEARDYLVWERPGEEPLAVIATHAAAALRYLVLRIGAERPSKI
jgi:hypothetical protein